MTTEKMWNGEPFWGLGFEFDPQWLLTDAQKTLQAKLIDACAETLRPNAVESDAGLVYPRANFEKLAEMNLLGLLVPKEMGGLGENHVCAAMVVETIARYGCPSTAMCYTMHLGAVAALLFRAAHNPEFIPLLRRLDARCPDWHAFVLRPGNGIAFLVPDLLQRRAGMGTAGRSTKKRRGRLRRASPISMLCRRPVLDFNGNYSDLSCFLVLQRGESKRSLKSGMRSACAGTSRVRFRWKDVTCCPTVRAWSARSGTGSCQTTRS